MLISGSTATEAGKKNIQEIRIDGFDYSLHVFDLVDSLLHFQNTAFDGLAGEIFDSVAFLKA